MKSIKQGRGPSLLGGIMGIFMVLIGIVWTSIAMRADFLFAMFGVIWTLMALTITIYNFIGATRRNRPSMYDITDGDEEPDPLNELFGNKPENKPEEKKNTYDGKGFCPYCGAAAEKDYSFCRKCGKKLP